MENGNTSNGVYTAQKGAVYDRASNNGQSNGQSLPPVKTAAPTGIYGALDMARAGSTNAAARLNGSDTPHTRPVHKSRATSTLKPQTPPALDAELAAQLAPRTVPDDIRHLPRPQSLSMQVRYLRVLVFSAWLFVRLMFWQVYVRRYFRGYVESTNSARFVKYAREFRGFAIALGGVFIKLGQFVSTRVDALPEEIVRELESLQDEVPTIPFYRIRQTLEEDLGDLSKRYREFNETPIAAASLGQAHKARLLTGEKVVVKVQRPGIREICYTDLGALKVVAWVAMKFRFISRRADAIALTNEFGRVLLEELSYSHEARNALIFAKFFKDDMGVYIPSIYTQHSTDRVLTMEDVSSIKITDFAALEAAGISRKAVAKRLMDTYLRQIFEQYFFHADPHPGNLFIYPLPVENVEQYIVKGGGRPFYLIFIDFGMTGTLTHEIADGMVGTLQAILARDPKRLIYGYKELGFILPNADLDRIIEAAQAAFNEVWGLSMTEIRDLDFDRAANLANEFNDLIKAMPFYIPQDFIYLGRTISILSGMSTTLDPTFNPWHELEPYAQRLAAQGFGVNVSANGNLDPLSVVQSLFQGTGRDALAQFSTELNRRVNPLAPASEVLHLLQKGELRVISEPSGAEKARWKRLEAQSKATNRAIIFGSVLIASTLLYTQGYVVIALVGYTYCAGITLYGMFNS